MIKTKKQWELEKSITMYQFFGFFIFIPFIYYIFKHYKKLKSRYLLDDSVQRIYDTSDAYSEMGEATLTGFFTLFVCYIPVSIINAIVESKLLVLAISIPIIYYLSSFWLLPAAKCVAARYLGAVINVSRNFIALPKDTSNYSFLDHLKRIPLREQGEIEEIPLSKITKITRQGGSLFIHGKFGSRSISFGMRQKRDECIAAIQNAMKHLEIQPEIEALSN